MERNAVMSCPVPPDFWQPFLLNEATFLQKRLKMVKTGLDRQERSFKPIRIFEFHIILCRNQFFPCFHTVLPLFLACLQSFKDLSKHGRRFVDPRSRVCRSRSRPFLYFSHQNLFIDGQFGRSLIQHHQKIPPQYSFCSCK